MTFSDNWGTIFFLFAKILRKQKKILPHSCFIPPEKNSCSPPKGLSAWPFIGCVYRGMKQ